jgi:hypothetical protein
MQNNQVAIVECVSSDCSQALQHTGQFLGASQVKVELIPPLSLLNPENDDIVEGRNKRAPGSPSKAVGGGRQFGADEGFLRFG